VECNSSGKTILNTNLKKIKVQHNRNREVSEQCSNIVILKKSNNITKNKISRLQILLFFILLQGTGVRVSNERLSRATSLSGPTTDCFEALSAIVSKEGFLLVVS